MRVILVDNYDSFTYNLYQLIGEVCGQPPTVVRNDTPWADIRFDEFDAAVISPGPGRPDRDRDFGVSARVILDSGLPVLGVCLGHQGLCHLFGGEVVSAPEPMHGRISSVRHTGVDLFAGIPSPYRRRALPLAGRHVASGRARGAGVDRRRRRDGRAPPPPAVVGRAVPSRVDQQHLRPRAAGQLLRPRRGRSASAVAPARTAEAEHPRYDLHVQHLDVHPDALTAYTSLFAGGDQGFWLDSSSVVDGLSRFSVMGNGDGPLAEHVTYCVADGEVVVRRADGTAERVRQQFFDYLDDQLRAREVPAPAGLPFEFNLGYVGYLGYELKAETGGTDAHRAETPDAALLFADRALVLDHKTRTSYLLALSIAGDAAGTAEADGLAGDDRAGPDAPFPPLPPIRPRLPRCQARP